MNIADFTDSTWVTCFQEAAETIIGRSAQELANIREQSEDEFNKIFQEFNFQNFTFKLRVKSETWQVSISLLNFNNFYLPRVSVRDCS